MSAKTRNRSRRFRRSVKTVGGQWLLVLLSHTLATIVLMIAVRLLHVPICGG